MIQSRQRVTREISAKIGDKLGSYLVTKFPLFGNNREVIAIGVVSEEPRSENELRKNLLESEGKFTGLFEHTPVPFMAEDWSLVRLRIDELEKTIGLPLEIILESEPEYIEELYDLCTCRQVSLGFARLYGAQNVEEFLPFMQFSHADPDEVKGFAKCLIEFLGGATEHQVIANEKKVDGSSIVTRIKYTMPSAAHENWSSVIVSAENYTDQFELNKLREESLKFAAVSTFSGTVAHDLNNLLSIIRGSVDLLSQGAKDGPELIESISQAVSRGSELAQILQDAASNSQLEQSAADLKLVSQNSVKLLNRAVGDTIEVNFTTDNQESSVLIDVGKYVDVLLNLCVNSREAMPTGGEINLTVTSVTNHAPGSLKFRRNSRKFVQVELEDSGQGMDASELSNCTKIFFSTKKNGSGLGLASASDFVRRSNGQLEITSKPNSGTKVTMRFPSYEHGKVLDAENRPNKFLSAKRDSGCALLVDDDFHVLNVLRRQLEHLGWSVVTAQNAEHAVTILQSGQRFELILTDLTMPGEIDGIGLLEWVAQNLPDQKALLMSGHSDALVSVSREQSLGIPIIKKPFLFSDLEQKLEQIFKV